MERFKKRTIALVLASVITVAGSFAAGNYKNTLMGLKFNHTDNGGINMTVETKAPYSGNVSPMRKDKDTYILTLSEINSSMTGSPDLQQVSNNIASVEVKTLPYTNKAKGYTRIIIKTHNPISITGENRLFIPQKNAEYYQNIQKQREEELYRQEELRRQQEEERQEAIRKQREEEKRRAEIIEQEPQATTPEPEVVEEEVPAYDNTPVPVQNRTNPSASSDDAFNAFLLVMALLLLITVTIFVSIKAKNKIQELTGERIDIDTTDDGEVKKKEKEKDSKRKKIKNTIKKLDEAYSRTAVSAMEKPVVSAPVKTVKPSEELNVVDLDELFKEQAGQVEDAGNDVDPDENEALDDFLSGFSFDDEHHGEVIEENEDEGPGYDEEFYEELIDNLELRFSKTDIECIHQLLNTEINDSTMKNISQYAVSNPIKPDKQKVLEDLVASYTISQDVTFTKDDIGILKSLMNVELDNDFITDLRINPERTKEMAAEIEASKNKPRKPSEIITLSVKDMLPDLSEELKKQGGKRIESEVKPITVYASEGWEVSTLSLSEELPDLSEELNNKDAYTSKPSADYELVASGYEVEKLSISNELPDLSEVLKNPEKYEDKEPEPVKVDEAALLNNISNVQFKPFYDGSEKFEIINDFDDSEPFINLDNMTENKEDKEINEENKIEEKTETEEEVKEEVKEIKPTTEVKPVKTTPKEEFVPLKLERKVAPPKRERKDVSDDILKKIEATRAERIARRAKILEKRVQNDEKAELKQENSQQGIKCIFEGKTYNIISTAEFDSNKGCHLAKSKDGYVVLGYIGEKLIKLKEFDNLRSEKILARLSSKQTDEVVRYIVRIGVKKFIINVTDDNLEYLMAL